MRCVSIPFIAGQWSLPASDAYWTARLRMVSIPFIAGQWSLQCPLAARRGGSKEEFQSPSLRGSGRFGGGGAAQRAGPHWFQSPSLRGSGRFRKSAHGRKRQTVRFQSPSLRGSGRFPKTTYLEWDRAQCFNPLHCGAVVASETGAASSTGRRRRFNPLHCGAVVASVCLRPPRRKPRPVSIPFIAGQWSLHGNGR